MIYSDILHDLLHSWPSIHQISCKYSLVDQSYSNFEFSVVAILSKINGAYYKNRVICPQIWYDLLYSWPSIHKFPCTYSNVYQSYRNFEFSVAAILKIQNGGRYSSQITCIHFLNDSNNKKLSIHTISCFYDNLKNVATNRSTMITDLFAWVNQARRAYQFIERAIWLSLWDAATKSKFSFVLKLIETWNVYNMILMYITLFTNETFAFRLIFFFGFTVDNGGSQNTERIGKLCGCLSPSEFPNNIHHVYISTICDVCLIQYSQYVFQSCT